MERFNTVIVGAGPAGLRCARLLAGAGHRVLVLERREEVGPKPCAGGITWAGLVRRVPAHLIEQAFPVQHIRSSWQHTAIRAAEPIIATVDRGRLGAWMLAEAQDAGATVLSGVAARAVERDAVVTEQGRFGYAFLVGADGSASLVRRFLGLPAAKVGMGVNCMLPGEFSRMEWHLDTRLFGNGYAWIFPHRRQASVGVYRGAVGMPAGELTRNLHRWAGKYGMKLEGLKHEAARISYDFRGWRFGNVFLAGDAAGLASGLTGEGIFSAILSAEAIAETILGSPGEAVARLGHMLRRHRQHTRMADLIAGHRFVRNAVMELCVAALRFRLVGFNALEMGS